MQQVGIAEISEGEFDVHSIHEDASHIQSLGTITKVLKFSSKNPAP
jgi:hypothetical protein